MMKAFSALLAFTLARDDTASGGVVHSIGTEAWCHLLRAYFPSSLTPLRSLGQRGEIIGMASPVSPTLLTTLRLVRRWPSEPRFNLSTFVSGPRQVMETEPCLLILGLTIAYVNGLGASGITVQYQNHILAMNWKSLLHSRWPIFTYLGQLAYGSVTLARYGIQELCQRLADQGQALPRATERDAMSSLAGTCWTTALGGKSNALVGKSNARAILNKNIGRSQQAYAHSSKTHELTRSSISLLSSIEHQIGMDAPIRKESRGLECWGSGISRFLCCGVAVDDCCRRSAVEECWVGKNRAGRTHQRCCEELGNDRCLHRFRASLAIWKRTAQPSCFEYASALALEFHACVAWTLPDHRFATEFAAPLLESGEGRCFEVEISLPQHSNGSSSEQSTGYAGIRSGALDTQRCMVAGCPWARFGVCTPLTCSAKDVRARWQAFLGNRPFTDKSMQWCGWTDARVFEYRTRDELVTPWSKPIKHLHFVRSGGTTFKTKLHLLHSETSRRVRPEISPLSGSPYLCSHAGRAPVCSQSNEILFSFAVRNPITMFMSHLGNGYWFSAPLPQVWWSPDELIHALSQPDHVSEAWDFLQRLSKHELNSQVGGLLNLNRCISMRRVSFVARTENVNDDALTYYNSLFDSRNITNTGEVHANLQERAR